MGSSAARPRLGRSWVELGWGCAAGKAHGLLSENACSGTGAVFRGAGPSRSCLAATGVRRLDKAPQGLAGLSSCVPIQPIALGFQNVTHFICDLEIEIVLEAGGEAADSSCCSMLVVLRGSCGRYRPGLRGGRDGGPGRQRACVCSRRRRWLTCTVSCSVKRRSSTQMVSTMSDGWKFEQVKASQARRRELLITRPCPVLRAAGPRDQ